MRLFIAVDLDEASREAVGLATTRFRQMADSRRHGLARGVKWVDPRNLHLTLHFIGELGDDRVPALGTAMAEPLGIDPARLSLGGWGVFPPRGPARVIWIGITGGVDALSLAHAALARRLERVGISPEARAFSPHLTVARVRVPSGPAWGDLTHDNPPPIACGCVVDHCTLYRSLLSSAGPAYEALLRIPFAGADESRSGADGRMP